MTYTHLTTNELVMIEAYHKNQVPVLQIAKSLKRTHQTIYKVIHFLEQGNSAMDYYNTYKSNKKRCGRRQTQLDDETKEFIQGYLEQEWSMDVIKGTFPEKIPFADPGCPGQRGLNEHSNGLLRRHGLPKQMDFNEVSQEFLSAIADKRNHISRKSLGYKTPYHVFSELVKLSNLI